MDKVKYLFYRWLFLLMRASYFQKKYRDCRPKVESQVPPSQNSEIEPFYQINGTNNRIIMIEDGKEFELTCKIPGLEISIMGNNNTIRIERPFYPENCQISIQNDDCLIELGSTTYFHSVTIECFLGRGQHFKMGRDTNIVEVHFILEEEGKITIGENCLFSNKILVRTSDGHSITNLDRSEVLSGSAGEIKIGNHVWVGTEVMFLKNSGVGDNSVIAARAIVNKNFDDTNVVLAGIPAKIVKHDINWRQENPWMIKNNQFFDKGK